ncbi:MAG: hypothetical protein AB7G87_10610 [Clostridia bacterium]
MVICHLCLPEHYTNNGGKGDLRYKRCEICGLMTACYDIPDNELQPKEDNIKVKIQEEKKKNS